MELQVVQQLWNNLTASPLTGYEFENWSSASGNIDSKSATFLSW